MSSHLAGLLEGETDRGVALAGAAYLEHAAAEMLRVFFVDDQQRAGWLLNGPNAPVGSFKARYQLAYCLGLLGPQMYADMENIRQVRNTFAHTYQPVDFSSPEVAQRCKGLQLPNLDAGHALMSPRARFIRSATLLAAYCLSQIKKLEHRQTGRDYKAVVTRFSASGVVAAPPKLAPEPGDS